MAARTAERERGWVQGIRTQVVACAVLSAIGPAGCGVSLNDDPAPLFVTPLSIDNQPIGDAIVDTGGGYELMLRNPFGLEIVGEIEVLAFGGRERVSVTEGFTFEAAGITGIADSAIVGLSVCNCNGLGFFFFRKSGVVLGLDFVERLARFQFDAPEGGITFPFAPPPPEMSRFDSAFLEITLSSRGVSHTLSALVDTGTNRTVVRRHLVRQTLPLSPDRQLVSLSRPELGVISLRVGLFDTEGLPDVIIGTDAMRLWADEWYFEYHPEGGRLLVFPDGSTPPTGPDAAASSGAAASVVR